jgi:flavorubredoxin
LGRIVDSSSTFSNHQDCNEASFYELSEKEGIMAHALIIYNTRKGATREIGNLIANGLTAAGITVVMKDAAEIKSEKDLVGYDAYLFGSATYHGEMMEFMKRILFLAEKAGLKGRVGGAFGAFGWSGEAPGRIFNTMLHIMGMRMVDEPLRLKSPSDPQAAEKAAEYGRMVADKLTT